MDLILKGENICKTFFSGPNPLHILKNIDLEIAKGEFVCVMGPSGSGKSTLLHIISGLEKPTSGRVILDGRDLFTLSEQQRTILRRHTIGFVFQFFNLIPNLTVEENISLPLLISGQDSDEAQVVVDEFIDFIKLDRRRHHYPNQLSGGEMQRVSVARALVTKAKLLFADEPTGNVSSRVGRQIMALLRKCCDEYKQSVLLVTHNPRDATYADRVFFLKDGVISSENYLEYEEVNEANIFTCLEKLDI
jgi:putative ABC transport system ATP-binding protein